MITLSVCMIVKNESKILARCLDSLEGIYDELVIVDTGSTDNTKQIAQKYTDKVYDFEWVDDFALARNTAFSYCTKDYIYSVDADEILDDTNRKKLQILKECMDPEIEIVQMYYTNQLEHGSVYNFDSELRPKIFKRERSFVWIEKIHETIREYPLVYDSDIEIIHKPEKDHTSRDCRLFEKITKEGERLSDRLSDFYAKELFISGTKEDFKNAEEYFTAVADSEDADLEQQKTAFNVVAKAAFERGDYLKMYKYAMKDVASDASCEICCILGDYHLLQGDLKEAVMWFYNAAFEECMVRFNLIYSRSYPLNKMIAIYRELGMEEEALQCENILKGEE